MAGVRNLLDIASGAAYKEPTNVPPPSDAAHADGP